LIEASYDIIIIIIIIIPVLAARERAQSIENGREGERERGKIWMIPNDSQSISFTISILLLKLEIKQKNYVCMIFTYLSDLNYSIYTAYTVHIKTKSKGFRINRYLNISVYFLLHLHVYVLLNPKLQMRQ
jgi:hypothetical protein